MLRRSLRLKRKHSPAKDRCLVVKKLKNKCKNVGKRCATHAKAVPLVPAKKPSISSKESEYSYTTNDSQDTDVECYQHCCGKCANKKYPQHKIIVPCHIDTEQVINELFNYKGVPRDGSPNQDFSEFQGLKFVDKNSRGSSKKLTFHPAVNLQVQQSSKRDGWSCEMMLPNNPTDSMKSQLNPTYISNSPEPRRFLRGGDSALKVNISRNCNNPNSMDQAHNNLLEWYLRGENDECDELQDHFYPKPKEEEISACPSLRALRNTHYQDRRPLHSENDFQIAWNTIIQSHHSFESSHHRSLENVQHPTVVNISSQNLVQSPSKNNGIYYYVSNKTEETGIS